MTYKIKEDPSPSDLPDKGGDSARRPPGKGAAAGPLAGPNISTEPVRARPTRLEKLPFRRLVSLDAFRGFIMVMLAAEAFGLNGLAHQSDDSGVWKILNRDSVQWLSFHFDHPPWQSSFVPGTHDAIVGSQWWHLTPSFWDLIQPAFMFMVGVAIPFSVWRRKQTGESTPLRIVHAFQRSLILVLLGVWLYSFGNSSTDWIFPNVLAQIGLGYFFVYLLAYQKPWVQGTAFALILVGTWGVMQFMPASPDRQPPEEVNAQYERGEIYAPPYAQWSKNQNFFHDFDVWFLNQFPRPQEEDPFRFNWGGYQTLNFVPSMGTMLLGLFCGQLLLGSSGAFRKFQYLLLAALLCWGLGVVAGATCCPIVKRIWTPSWVLFSGGYVIGMLALFYLLFDILPLAAAAFPLVVVGVNSLVVYILGELFKGESAIKNWLLHDAVLNHIGWAIRRVLGGIAISNGWHRDMGVKASEAGAAMMEAFEPVVEHTVIFAVIWLLAFWLYRQRAFLRI